MEMLNAWKTPLERLTIKEIQARLNKKSKPWVFNKLKKLVKNNVLKETRIGNINLYELNLDNPLTAPLPKIVHPILLKIHKALPEDTILIVFGSYAANKNKKASDLDICILRKTFDKTIKSIINDVKLQTTTKIDDHYVTYDEFIEMLVNDEENLGKQVFKNSIIMTNIQSYYKIIGKAVKNGFRENIPRKSNE